MIPCGHRVRNKPRKHLHRFNQQVFPEALLHATFQRSNVQPHHKLDQSLKASAKFRFEGFCYLSFYSMPAGLRLTALQKPMSDCGEQFYNIQFCCGLIEKTKYLIVQLPFIIIRTRTSPLKPLMHDARVLHNSEVLITAARE